MPLRRSLLLPLLAVAGVLAPFLPVIAGGRTLVAHDTLRLYAPLRGLVVDALRAGRLPLWNPYEATGVPLFAEALHGVLHPVSLLAALLAPGASMDLLILAYLALAAGGAYVLARALGAGEAAALVAAFSFGLSGFTVSMAANLVYLAGMAGAPWVVASMLAVGKGAGPRWRLPAVAVAVAASALAGEYQMLAAALLMGSALSAAVGGRHGLVRSGVGVVLGLSIAGVQLVPSWVYLQRSTRANPIEGMLALQWPLEPWRLAEWLLPGFFCGRLGAGDTSPFLLLGGPTIAVTPFTQSVFVGSIVLLLALAGATGGRTAARTRLALLAVTGVCLWLALGHRLGASAAVEHLPVLGSLRYPEKWMGPIALGLSSLAALGADRVVAGEVGRRWERALFALLGAVALAWGLAVLSPGAVEGFFAAVGQTQESQPMVRLPADAAARAREHLARGAAHAALALGALALLLQSAKGGRSPWRAPGLAALVFLELGAAIPSAAWLGARAPPGERLLPLVEDAPPMMRIVVPVSDPDRPVFLGGGTGNRAQATRLGVASAFVPLGVDFMGHYGAMAPRRWDNLVTALGDGRWVGLRRFSATTVVVPPPQGPSDAEVAAGAVRGGALVTSDPTSGATVWAVPHRPWALFPDVAVTLPSPYEVHDRLLAAIAAGDPTVFVETGAAVSTGPGVVRSFTRKPELVRIDAEAPGDALLVVNDAFHPGWRAMIDGRPVELMPADILVRAVRWPAGRHELVMVYDPPEVRWGIALSLAGAVLVVAAWRRAPRGAAGGLS
jgi:hypothetical protein